MRNTRNKISDLNPDLKPNGTPKNTIPRFYRCKENQKETAICWDPHKKDTPSCEEALPNIAVSGGLLQGFLWFGEEWPVKKRST